MGRSRKNAGGAKGAAVARGSGKKQRCARSGKRVFLSEDRAREALVKIRLNPNPILQALGYLPYRVYRCRHCSYWHLAGTGNGRGDGRRRRKGSMAY
jgi:hypothetical protein